MVWVKLVGLGVAVIIAAALNNSKHSSNKNGSRDRRRADRASRRPLADEAPHAAQLSPQSPAQPPLPAPARLQRLQLLVRLVLSLLFTVVLHRVVGTAVPWPSALLTAAALFVLTEVAQQKDGGPQAIPERRRSVKEAAPSLPAQVPLQDFSGLWIKDKEASESMEEACSLMEMNGLLRTAVRLIKGLRIRQGGGEFEMAVLSGILWFKVTERYPLDGCQRSWKRRDLRRGKHLSSVHPLPDGSLQMRLSWPDPLGGVGTDTFFCPDPGTLWVDSVLTVGGRTVKYRQVYHRQE